MVHIEDAEALLNAFYDLGWHEKGIPKHPGATRRRTDYDKVISV